MKGKKMNINHTVLSLIGKPVYLLYILTPGSQGVLSRK